MIKRRSLLALPGAIVVAGALPGCGGGGSNNGGGSVRLVNATGKSSIDLRVSNTNLITAVAKGAVSSYVSVGEGTSAFQIGTNGQTSVDLTQSATVSKDVAYTMVAYSNSGAVNAAFFADSEAAPSSGTAKIRLFNAAVAAGSLDLYVVAAGQSITGVTATNATVASQRVGAYTQTGAGSYRIVVTGAGDQTDVRLDLASVALTDQQVLTLVATSTAGGLLVDGLLINQAGTVQNFGGTTVRLRLVANRDTNAPVTVTLTVGGTDQTLFGPIVSPSVENYVSVPADLSTLKINGAAPTGLNLAPTVGSDLTLLVYGDGSATKLLVDDNTLPTSASKAKIRLVNAINNLNESISMVADFSLVASSVALGASSAPVQVTPTTTMDLVVTSPSNSTGAGLKTFTDVGLTADHVYTVFMLGAQGAVQGVLRQDR